MNERLIRRVKALRAASITPLPITMAFAIARAEQTPPVGPYPFLAALDTYPPTQWRVNGVVHGLNVVVEIEQDEYYTLGEDDVTGQFTDQASERTIKNDGGTRNGYKFYEMSNERWSEGVDAMRRRGMSRSVARQVFWDQVRQDMEDDRERSAWNVNVSVWFGSELAAASLCGIDEIESVSVTPDLVAAAVDLIDEAIGQVRATRAVIVARALSTVARALSETEALVAALTAMGD